ncbi:MAG: ATP-grasp domain-containing protein [Gammaproteobacteria bacterium]|nr:ATP-grasp domain-containing protein [Gammaproteobacteria bacterium]
MKQLTVAITGMNAKPDNPGPGLAVARCLREAEEFNGKIIGLGYDILDPALYLETICDDAYLLPYPSVGEKVLLERIKEIHTKNPIDILIPCLDAELYGFINLKNTLESMGIMMLIPTMEQLHRRNKDRLDELAKKIRCFHPKTQKVTERGFFYQCELSGWNYPFVIKGQYYDAQIVHNATEAVSVFDKLSHEWGVPVLIQEFIEGGEINLAAIGDGHGDMQNVVMIRKKTITDKGKAWAGVSVWDNKLYDISQRLIDELQWQGPLEVEMIQDSNNNYYLLEINPGFPAWIYLSSQVERNQPLSLVNQLLGNQYIEKLPPQTGQLFIRYALETVLSLGEFESMLVNGCKSQTYPVSIAS